MEINVLRSAFWCSSLAMACAAAVLPAYSSEVTSIRQHAAAQAAGVTALHYCTGRFATEATPALIDATLATNASPAAPSGDSLKVDAATMTVAVRYAQDMPPRIAVGRPALGCVLLPIGARNELASNLVRPAMSVPDLDKRPWPIGDANAAAQLPRRQQQQLETLIDGAFRDESGPYLGISWGIVVIQNGKIVAERYQHGFSSHVAARTNSMCKSLGATLIGVGVRQGFLDLQREAPLAEWRRPGDPRGEITLDNLLHMASGLYTDGPHDPQREIYQSGASIAEMAALNMVNWKPGSRFVYAGTDVNLALRALRQSVADDARFVTLPYRELLWKTGMTRTIIETDWNNDYIVSGQCWSTARDFGRFGMLYLSDGMWGEERLLPAGWSRYVATPAPAQPPKGSIGGNAGYGAQFWLHGGMEGLPKDAYAAFGSRGQYAVIIPSRNMVIVRRGFDRDAPFHIQKFVADVVKVLGS